MVASRTGHAGTRRHARRPGTPSPIRPVCDPAPDRLAVLYDEDCGFCRATLAWLLRLDRRKALLPESITSPVGERLLADLTLSQRLERAHAVAPDGRRWSGGDAVAPVLRLLPGGAPFALVAATLAAPARKSYDWVARHRVAASRLIPARAKSRARGAIHDHRQAVLASTPDCWNFVRDAD